MPDDLIQFRVDADKVAARISGLYGQVVGALETRLDALTAALQAKIVGEKLSGDPIKTHTGKLAGSVRQVPVAKDGDILSAGVAAGGGPAFYAKFLEDGTAAHLIMPVNKQALMFLADGKTVFSKVVHHPGTPAYRFMSGTLEESKDAIIASLESAVAGVMG